MHKKHYFKNIYIWLIKCLKLHLALSNHNLIIFSSMILAVVQKVLLFFFFFFFFIIIFNYIFFCKEQHNAFNIKSSMWHIHKLCDTVLF